MKAKAQCACIKLGCVRVSHSIPPSRGSQANTRCPTPLVPNHRQKVSALNPPCTPNGSRFPLGGPPVAQNSAARPPLALGQCATVQPVMLLPTCGASHCPLLPYRPLVPSACPPHAFSLATPSLAAVTGGGVQGGGARPAVPGGGGVNPTSMAQNDTHVALIILTTQMWGGGGLLVEKTFSGQILCSCAFGANIRSYTKQRVRHRTPFPHPPPPPSAGVHVSPPAEQYSGCQGMGAGPGKAEESYRSPGALIRSRLFWCSSGGFSRCVCCGTQRLYPWANTYGAPQLMCVFWS